MAVTMVVTIPRRKTRLRKAVGHQTHQLTAPSEVSPAPATPAHPEYAARLGGRPVRLSRTTIAAADAWLVTEPNGTHIGLLICEAGDGSCSFAVPGQSGLLAVASNEPTAATGYTPGTAQLVPFYGGPRTARLAAFHRLTTVG